MDAVSFTTRSFQIADGPMGAREVVLGTLVSVADARALATAIAWQRSRRFQPVAVEAPDDVLELRRMVGLLDQLEALGDGEHAGPLTFSRAQVSMLAEAAATYLAEFDVDAFQSPELRERLSALRRLTDALFDLSAAFAGAEAEAAAQLHRD